MVQNKSTAKVAKKEAVFNPASLTKEQQEAVVEEYLGFHPRYFIYEGLAIRFNRSRFEADERTAEKKENRPRRWFNKWRPQIEGWEIRL